METIEIIVEETVQPIILEVYQEITPPIVLESYEGKSGDSAYVEAVKNGFVGTEQEWLESLKGDKGDTGEQGEQGIQGIQGLKGDKGDQGEQGLQGVAGNNGTNGVDGTQGIQGLKGDKGEKGDVGEKGDKGDTGLTGATGAQGTQGIQGLKGDKGDTGTTGAQGIQGLKGDTGLQGIQGETGATGPNASWGNITGSLSNQTDLQTALNNKVDKVTGKGLSTNDYTTIEKTKLSTIASGAEVNVNADWDATGGDAEILNKPTIPSIAGLATVSYVDSQDALKVDKVSGKSLILDSEITRLSTVTNFDNSGNVTALANKVDKITGKQLSTEDYTTTEKTKLSGISTGATANDTDANLKNRANHTGSQLASTISDFATAVGLLITNKVDKITGYSLTKNDLTDALKTAYDNAVSSLATLLATGSRLITSGEITKLSNTSGTNTGDQDLSGKVDKVTGKSLVLDTEIARLATIATNANVGVVPNIAITGATKTKITYDSKGLVTAGADATTADIADSTNKRYVTDVQLTVIGNTSGTNSGDNATNSQYSGLAITKEDTANKSTSTSDSASSTKFPVWSVILSYFDSSRLKTILGISTLSGSNTGDETSATIISKLGYNPIKTVVRDAVQSSTITGTTVETLLGTYLIPANTFSANDLMRIVAFTAEKTGTVGTVMMRVKVGTSSIFGSATTIATYTISGTNLSATVVRNSLTLRGGNIRALAPTSSNLSDIITTNAGFTNIAFNPAVDNYIFTSMQLLVSTDSIFQSNFLVTN